MTVAVNISTFERIGNLLAELIDEIEALGVRLCSDLTFAVAHGLDLQAIDHIAQKQRSLAGLLRADCLPTALDQLGLDDLKAQLKLTVPPNSLREASCPSCAVSS